MLHEIEPKTFVFRKTNKNRCFVLTDFCSVVIARTDDGITVDIVDLNQEIIGSTRAAERNE